MLMLFPSVVQLPKSFDLMQERVKKKQLIGFPPFYISKLHQIAVNFCVFENVCMCDSSSLSRCAACTYTCTVNSYSFNKKNPKHHILQLPTELTAQKEAGLLPALTILLFYFYELEDSQLCCFVYIFTATSDFFPIPL